MARSRKSNKDELPKSKINKENIKITFRLGKYLTKHKWKFVLGIICLIGTGGTAILFPKLLGDLFKAGHLTSSAINEVMLYLVVLLVAQAIFSFFRVVLFVNVTQNMLEGLRTDAFSNLVKMPMAYFSRNKANELNSRMAADVGQIQDAFTTAIAEFLRQTIILIGGIIALFIISFKLSLLMLATIPVVVIAAVFFGKYIKRLSRDAQDEVAVSTNIVGEALQGIANVKSFTNELFEMLRYRKSAKEIKRISIKGGVARASFSAFMIFCIFGAIILLIWYAVKLEHSNELEESQLITFILYTIFVGASIAGLPLQYAEIQKAIGASERVFEIIDQNPEDLEEKKNTVPLEGKVDFEHVNFTYPSRKDMPVLKDINFKVAKGETIAIVGPSGSGKTTLSSLILRFYEPDTGSIIFDNKKASEYGLNELRKQMAVVPQEVLLFGGSIKENIAYGRPGATEEDILEAAKKANAHDFILSFPEKYDTLVGERGIQLSGGQRQRIAIARAVLKNPAILILDEATSSLDSDSESLVQDALDKLMQGRTSFVIAHRLSTIRNADKIVVIKNGEIIETGTHKELIASEGGLYQHLSQLQMEIN